MADRYWVGGTANWDATAGTKWALTSGGAGGQAVPTAADDVYIDSGSGAVTVTVSGARVCRDLRFVSGAGAFTGTFAGTGGITISGSMVLSASMTHTYTGTNTFNATDAQTITANGISIDAPVTFNGAGGAWTLQDNFATGSTRATTLTQGTIDLNDKTYTTGVFTSGVTNARTIAFGAGKFILTGNAATIFGISTATNLTVTGTPTVDCTYSGGTGTRQLNGGGATTYDVTNPKINFNITAGTDTVSLGGVNVFGNVNFTGFTGSYGFTATDPQLFGDLTFGTGMTGPSSATRSLRFMATSGTQTITSNSVTINSGITCEGGGTYSFADALTMGSTNTLVFSLGTIKLKNGVTSTVGVFSTSGTTQKSLESTSAGSQATLSQASGTVNATYLNVKDISATGGAAWNAVNASFNYGNNSGWFFAHQQGNFLPSLPGL